MRKKATSFLDRVRGLMFESTGEVELEFVLPKETRHGASVHTFFMQYPIRVEWFNSKRELVDWVVLQPWTFNYTPVNPAKYILERKSNA